MSTVSRVMVIGLDGATLDLIEPWVQAGHLPVLASLMRSGGYSRLRSVFPVVSSAAWATFMTGTNPGKHGVFDFVYREAGSYRLRPVNRQHIAMPSLWRLLSEQGRRVGVLNVPITYPPEQVNGFIVSGLGTPDFKCFTYPPELGNRLLQNGYRVNRRVYYPWGNEEAFLRDTYEITERLTTTALSLLAESTWDFFMVVYRDTDNIAHGFWHHMDPSHPDHDPVQSACYRNVILDFYRRLDGYLGDLIAAAGHNTAVFIISDHGLGPLYKEVFLNEWLHQRGYLVPRPLPFHRQFLSRVGLTRENISRLLRWAHLGRLERMVKDLLGDRIFILPRTGWSDFSDGIDWPRTRAYSFGYQGQIYINLAGREPQGIVAPGGEYEALREELCQALRELRDPEDGQPVVDRIYKREEIYWGPNLFRAPDLVVVMRNFAYITRLGYEFSSQSGQIFGPSRIRESGGHRLDGVLIAAGPGITRATEERPVAWLGDVMPTILHLLGCAIPEFVDGRVLREWLVPDLADRPVLTYQWMPPDSGLAGGGLTASEEEEILGRLSDLGYLG
ncbi:MAG: alkaline phosphatase family protein [Candidatus Hadarchaeum sp.]